MIIINSILSNSCDAGTESQYNHTHIIKLLEAGCDQLTHDSKVMDN